MARLNRSFQFALALAAIQWRQTFLSSQQIFSSVLVAAGLQMFFQRLHQSMIDERSGSMRGFLILEAGVSGYLFLTAFVQSSPLFQRARMKPLPIRRSHYPLISLVLEFSHPFSLAGWVAGLSLFIPAGLSPHPAANVVLVLCSCAFAYGTGFALSYWLGSQPFTSGVSRKSLYARFTWPGQYGPLFQKELFYFGRVLDIYGGVLLGWIAGISNLYQHWLSANKSIVVVALVLAANVAPMLAPFGTDSQTELGRYSTLPVSPMRMLAVKELAVAALSVVQVGPIWLSCMIGFGIYDGILVLLSWIITLLAYGTVGNLLLFSTSAVLRPFRPSASSSIINVLLGIGFGSLPVTACVVVAVNRGANYLVLLLVLCSAAILGAYSFSLNFAAQRITRRGIPGLS